MYPHLHLREAHFALYDHGMHGRLPHACPAAACPAFALLVWYVADFETHMTAFPTLSSSSVKPLPRRSLVLYLTVWPRTMGFKLPATGRGKAALALSARAEGKFAMKLASGCRRGKATGCAKVVLVEHPPGPGLPPA